MCIALEGTMTRIGFILLALLSLGLPLLGQSESTDRAEVEGVMTMYLDARNARDAEAVAKFFADDYDQGNLTTGNLQIKSGKERSDAYREAFQTGRMRNTMQSSTKTFRLISDDVALLDAELAMVNAEGQREFTNFATFIFVKRDGVWLIGAVRMSPLAETQPGS